MKFYRPIDESQVPTTAQLAKFAANRRTIAEWLRSRREVFAFFDANPHRRHAVFVATRRDYASLFGRAWEAAALRASKAEAIGCVAQHIPTAHTVVRLLAPMERLIRFADTEAEARENFDAAWRDRSGVVGRDIFWTGTSAPWREITQ